MAERPDPDLVKTTEIFLISISFLVAALGTADSNVHRAVVSLVGFVLSLLWWVCSHEALREHQRSIADAAAVPLSRRMRVMYVLPVFFGACWAVSMVIHVSLWRQPIQH